MLSLQNLDAHQIKMITNAVCKEITGTGVKYEKDGKIFEETGDSAVFAVGARAFDESDLENICKELSVPYHMIGDAKKPRRALDAVREAVELSLSI